MPQITRSNGFTLVELLVVLVITGLTTSLLITGLGSTWNNFDRLSNNNITIGQAQLPKSWFIKSINAALLGHPDTPLFNGSQFSFSFISYNVPNDPLNRPQKLTWRIDTSQSHRSLIFSTIQDEKNENIEVWAFTDSANVSFEYLVQEQWVSDFTPAGGEIPRAIRVIDENTIWAMSTPHRPQKADIPAEYLVFGKYEF